MATAPVSKAGKWMALTAALLGWMFDGMEMGLFPLVQKPALEQLLGKDGVVSDQDVAKWIGIATAGFLIGAATGGVLFGWLGDRIGRVRAMTLSVLTYTVVSGACAYSTEAWQVVMLRFLAALGMGGEWSLGVALINEVWPGRSRAFLAGLIGAAANVGFFLSGFSSRMLHSEQFNVSGFLVQTGLLRESNGNWRLMMLVGAVPAMLCFFIRIFVPESQRWEEERSKGATSHWATRDLLGVVIGAAGAIGIVALWAVDLIMPVRIAGTLAGFVIAAAGFLFPVVRYLIRAEAADQARHDDARHRTGPTLRRMLLGAGLSGVALVVTWGSVQQVSTYTARQLESRLRGSSDAPLTEEQRDEVNRAREATQMWSAVGAIVFSILAALFSDWAGRRISYFLQCVIALISVLCCYQLDPIAEYLGVSPPGYGAVYLVTVFLMGGLCSTFYGWLPLYLPELFRTRVRATGQGFCYNFGRILAAIGALQIGNLFTLGGGYATVCSNIALVYIVGMIIIWFVPETHGKPLPE